MFFKRRKKEVVTESEQSKFRIVEYDNKFTVQKLTWQPSMHRSYFYYSPVQEYDSLADAKGRMEALKKNPIIHL